MKSIMDHGRQKRKKKREDVVKKKQKREKEWVKGRSYKHLCPLRSVHEFRQRGSQRKLCGFWVKAKEKNVFETFFCLFFVCEWWLFCALPFTLWMLNIEPAKNTEKRSTQLLTYYLGEYIYIFWTRKYIYVNTLCISRGENIIYIYTNIIKKVVEYDEFGSIGL